MKQSLNNRMIFGVPFRRLKGWIFVGSIALLIGLFLFGKDGFWKISVRNRDLDRFESHIDSLAALNKQMHERLTALKNGDKAALEEEARSRGMTKPGEKVYVIKEKPEKTK